MTYTIDSRTLPEQPCAVVRASLPAGEVASWLPGVYRDVATYLTHLGTTPGGPPFGRFTFHDGIADVEAGFPVHEPVPAHDRVVPSALPAGPAAVTTHYGRYEDLVAAYDAVAAWLKEHGHEPAGPHWEVYYTDPQAEPDPAGWRTDLVAPYRQA